MVYIRSRNQNRNLNRKLSKVVTGTRIVTCLKSEPELENIVTVPQYWVRWYLRDGHP
jgi:hypothetical protein